MIRSKLVKSFILGLSLSVIFSTAVFAESERDQEVKIQIEQIGAGTDAVIGLAPDTPVASDENTSAASAGNISVTSDPVSKAMYQKQSEIDKLLFENHKEELAQKGITVTHTGATNEYVEIGITPFNEDHAAYLKQLLGDGKIKVVEGLQAIPYSDAAEGSEELMYATGAPVDEAPVEDANIVLAEDDVQVVSATAETVSATSDTTLSASLIAGIAAAVLAVLGGILVMMKKLKTAR